MAPLSIQDLTDLQRICRWSVIYDGVESRFDQIGRLAADVLRRHGCIAFVEPDSGAVKFEKSTETKVPNG